jgi:hypothetical protein
MDTGRIINGGKTRSLRMSGAIPPLRCVPLFHFKFQYLPFLFVVTSFPPTFVSLRGRHVNISWTVGSCRPPPLFSTFIVQQQAANKTGATCAGLKFHDINTWPEMYFVTVIGLLWIRMTRFSVSRDMDLTFKKFTSCVCICLSFLCIFYLSLPCL